MMTTGDTHHPLTGTDVSALLMPTLGLKKLPGKRTPPTVTLKRGQHSSMD